MIESPAFIISIQSKRLNRVDVTLLKSQDGEKSRFFIYSIYGYKNSSLPGVFRCDVGSQVALMWRLERAERHEPVWRAGALFRLPGGILPKGGSRPRSASRFPMRRARAQTPGCKHVWMKKQAKPSHAPFPHGGPVNY